MRHIIVFTLLCIILIIQFLPAQAPDTLWTRTYGYGDEERGQCVQQTTDGGYIIVGWANGVGFPVGVISGDIRLIKTDHLGQTLWTKTFGDSLSDGGECVQQTSDGGYIITGWREVNSYLGHIYLIKTSPMGDSLWTKSFGGDFGFILKVFVSNKLVTVDIY